VKIPVEGKMLTSCAQFDDQPQAMNYVQVFHLLSDSGNYFVQNDVFRLVYPS
jgi:hypothetical protein